MKSINVISARQNNLKNITVSIPYYQLNVVTGKSGSGKSSLVYNTIFAESQRAFYESLLESNINTKIMEKPDVQRIERLCPAISVSQQFHNVNPRSTVGTMTDISYYLRNLFSSIVNYEYFTRAKDSFFSFNNSKSWCENCKGLGRSLFVDIKKVVPDESKSLRNDAILYFKGKDNSLEKKELEEACNIKNIDLDTPFCELSSNNREFLLYSKEKINFDIRYRTSKGRYKQKNVNFQGVINELNERLRLIESPSVFRSINKFLSEGECNCCSGLRLSEKVLEYIVCDLNYGQIEKMDMEQLLEWLKKVKLKYLNAELKSLINEIVELLTVKIQNIIQLKLAYLNCGRSIPTLSGGEAQRLRIANQLTCSLTELLYILDEPCRGLHFRDVKTIINAAKRMVEKGNTVIAIEHNRDFIEIADNIILMGPGAGPFGGEVVAQGKYDDIFTIKEPSIVKVNVRKNKKLIKLTGATKHNIKDGNIQIPVNTMAFVTGVSGSGKSTLIKEVLYPSINIAQPVNCKSIEVPVGVKKCYLIDQSPIGKTSRSSVISYIDIYEEIRNIMASSELAKNNKFTATHFSINCEGGRCEKCQGLGYIKIDIPFMSESYSLCDECDGKQYKNEILNIKVNDKSIYDIMQLTVKEAKTFFIGNEKILRKLECLSRLGLDYIKLGQPSMNLSGGEAQRIRLAKVLGENIRKGSILLIDEPSTGLSDEDINKLSEVLNNIVDNGNSIVCIEHNYDFIKENADYVIDMGNHGGSKGGKIIAQGTFFEVSGVEQASIRKV